MSDKRYPGDKDFGISLNVTTTKPLDDRTVIASREILVTDVYDYKVYDGLPVVVPNVGVYILHDSGTYNSIISAENYVAPSVVTDETLATYGFKKLQDVDLAEGLLLGETTYTTIESYLTAVNGIIGNLVANSSGIMSVNGKSDAAIVLYASDITMASGDDTTIKAYVEALSAKLSTAVVYKGTVATFDDLPTDASHGDMYNVTATDKNYVWNSTGGDEGTGAWDDVGGLVDLTPYQTITDNTLTTTSKTVPGAINELDAEVATNTSAISTLDTTVAGHTTSISSINTSLASKADSSTVTALTTRVGDNEVAISGLESDIEGLESDIEGKADATDLETLEGEVSSLSTQVSTNTTNIADKVSTTTYNSKVTELETAIGTKVTAVTGMGLSTNDYTDADQTAVSNIDSTISTAISTKQDATDTSLTTTAKTITGAINELDTDVGANTTSISSLTTRVSAAETSVSALVTTVGDTNSGLVNTTATNTTNISALTTTVGNSESGLVKDVADNASAISDLESAIETLESAVDNIVVPEDVSDLNNDLEFQTASQVTSTVNTAVSTHNSSTTAHEDIRSDIDDLEAKIEAINAINILNLSSVDSGVITATETTVSTVATAYISDNYDREPANLDGLVITLTDRDNDKVQYVYMTATTEWVDIGSARTEISTATSTTSGIAKLYTTTDGSNTDGSVTQSAINTALGNKVSTETGKGLSSNDYTDDEKTKLSGIEAGAQVNTVTSVAGKIGAVTLTSSDVGLGNVDNTSDANKPVSTATQTALDAKAGVDASNLSTTNVTSWKSKLGIPSSFSDLTNNPFTVSDASIAVSKATIVINSTLTKSVLIGSSSTLTIPEALGNFKLYNVDKNLSYIIDGSTIHTEALGNNNVNSISAYTVDTSSTVVTFTSSVDGEVFKVEYNTPSA